MIRPSRQRLGRETLPAVCRLFPAIFIGVPRTEVFDRQLSSLFLLDRSSVPLTETRDERSQ